MAFELQDGSVNLDGVTISLLIGEGKGREWMWGLLRGGGTGIQHAGDSLLLFYPDGRLQRTSPREARGHREGAQSLMFV